MTVTATAFGAGSIPGVNQRTDIVSAINSYPYPGSITKASARTDCVGTTCTYTEEMTNYANWWAYYHTRMQMMKTSASIAFAPVDINYRVGYLSINNNTSSDFLNIGKFDGTQKNTWYTKITSAIPGSSTPLRTALTKAGRLYAGKLNGTTLNGSTVADPIQYSCQQNFTILSTDGYWNEANPGGYQLDGTTAIGNQDSAEPRPMLDGNGTSNTLADVSEYYYANDLRTTALGNCTGSVVPPATTGNTLCSSASPDPYNNVPTSGLDGASWQHMTTFTLGLGASGYMQYSPNYVTASSGDFFDVKNGTAANTGICSWQASGICNWPIPVSNTQTTIDDLWHTAVNGRGTYFSATNPASLSSGLSSALAGVSARTGSSAAATTSNPNVTSGDNFVFSSTFTTQEWDGELVRQQLDLTTGITSSTIDWAAQSSLDTKVAGTGYTTRTIYTFDSTTVSKLKPFTWTDLTSTEQAYFSSPYVTLSQFCTTGVTCLSATNQANAVGANLVNFLRGDRSNEGTPTDTSKYYHLRLHVLGDIVNAEAVYVKASLFNFADRGYSDFKTANATRQGMVYAAANDGMLHAFYAASNSTTGVVGGNEAWAYIPSIILPKLNKLADKNYSSLHQYFVDGTPIVGEICVSDCATTISSAPAAVWKTILVGGLNGGGRGYYALDITNPASPKALWEFTDTNMGFTYGNPKIGKLKDGTWAVFVTSGYNNVSPGDGQGRLYVLNANTGALIRSIATGVGKPAGSTSSVVAADGTTVCTATTAAPAACPSGLARIAAPVISTSSDNTVRMIYGGDLYGNLWRFDVNGDLGASGYDAQLLATFRGPSPASNVQPITAKPQVGDVSGNLVIYVGTGSYLGTADLTDTSMQSIYALKDTLPATSTPSTAIYGVPRTFGGFVQQTQTNTVCPAGSPPSICITGQLVRTSSSNVVNFASDNGWFLDLPDSGERANTDPTLGLGTLGFTTNVPNSSACTVGGYSYRYFLDYRTGAAVSTSTTKVVAAKLGNALATRPVYVRLPNNTIVELTRLSDGTTVTSNVPIGNAAGATRRVSWRELISE
jgi:type IV pilus assembly protein PilY1